ncbi:hypothetical protein EIN_249320 [Entamoeba invadens IP1]|uniref:F-box domain-containing protein n=1 Tax=Entamoeba invadens IP1 TaxID=370355 RepID=A0A0A1UEI7_ENTIV|nr:hypothetical protein EIN_249320 [Entamoeba invadens IP1]ELP94898.1 hypothetical protein EIN_249320 [Entamoeba invadens IP1]|eukprot:XP_004261669.1 hypothetical protein EIN_249320 [Entamoeba invadens IP1]
MSKLLPLAKTCNMEKKENGDISRCGISRKSQLNCIFMKEVIQFFPFVDIIELCFVSKRFHMMITKTKEVMCVTTENELKVCSNVQRMSGNIFQVRDLIDEHVNFVFKITVNFEFEAKCLGNIHHLETIREISINSGFDARRYLYRMTNLEKLKHVASCQIVPITELSNLKSWIILGFELDNKSHTTLLDYAMKDITPERLGSIHRVVYIKGVISQYAHIKSLRGAQLAFMYQEDRVIPNSFYQLFLNESVILHNTKAVQASIKDFQNLMFMKLYKKHLFTVQICHCNKTSVFTQEIVYLENFTDFISLSSKVINLISLSVIITTLTPKTVSFVSCSSLTFFKAKQIGGKTTIHLPSSIMYLTLDSYTSDLSFNTMPNLKHFTTIAGNTYTNLFPFTEVLSLYLPLEKSFHIPPNVKTVYLKSKDKVTLSTSPSTKVVMYNSN